MASIFKQQYTTIGKDGKRIKKKSAYWYIDYKAAGGMRKRLKGFKDKTATVQLAAKLEKEAELAQAGVIDRFKEHRKRPLKEHLEDFKASLVAKSNTEKHAEQQTRRIKAVFDTCGFNTWQDISASKVQKAISTLHKTAKIIEREKLNGKLIRKRKEKDLGLISLKTQGYYLKAVKQFCRWMVQDSRATESPVEHLQPKRATSAKRRALEPDEVRILLENTQNAETMLGMTGYERALLYRLAIETGLRVSELKSLRAENFDFENNTVIVAAAYTKNRTEAILPLKQDTAGLLKDFLKLKLPSEQAFNVPHNSNFAKMLRKDLAAAKVENTGMDKLDFHSLRHTFGTMLAASGVHPKTAQDLMRHSDINLTMSRYTHTLRGQTQKAIESLPDLTLPSSQSQTQKATGTDGQPANGAYKPAYKKLTKNAYSGLKQSSLFGNEKSKTLENATSHKSCENSLLGIRKDQMSLSGLERARQDSNLQPSDSKSATLSN